MDEIVDMRLHRSLKLSLTKKDLKQFSKSELIKIIFELKKVIVKLVKENENATSNAGISMQSETPETKGE